MSPSPYRGPVTLLGVPWDEHSSFLSGAADAPSRIRRELHSDGGNPWTETGLDLSAEGRLRDHGDLDLADRAMETIEDTVSELLAAGRRILTLGGDHAVTYPILRAYGRAVDDLTVVQIDAHPDLYPEFDRDPLSHACVFSRVMEEGLARRLVQVGIRTATGVQRQQAERFAVEMVEMKDFRAGQDLGLDGPVYLTLDLDGLDPAFAPGVSHREPGGLSVREVVAIIHRLGAPLVGADVVEYNPRRDLGGVTASVAAKLVKEISARMLAE